MKHVLITGGAGFIGSHLCEEYVRQGHLVRCIDNFSTGEFRNIEHLFEYSNFHYANHDISDNFDFDADEIFNLASPASPIHYQADPIGTTRTNVLGALNVLDVARKKGCRVLQASTSEIYGDALIYPQAEDYFGNVNPIGIRSCYDEGKRCAESLFFDYHRQYGIEIKVVRIFNCYGPRMRLNDGRVIPNFVLQALRGEPLTIYGDGSQLRSFCYIDDLISGIVRMMRSLPDVTGPINLGSPNSCSIIELADLIRELVGSRSKIVRVNLPLDDPKQRCPDISLAREKLDNWLPNVDLRTGLLKTLEYFENELRTGGSGVHGCRKSTTE